MEVLVDQLLHVFFLHVVGVFIIVATLFLVEVVLPNDLLKRYEDVLGDCSQVLVVEYFADLVGV